MQKIIKIISLVVLGILIIWAITSGNKTIQEQSEDQLLDQNN